MLKPELKGIFLAHIFQNNARNLQVAQGSDSSLLVLKAGIVSEYPAMSMGA